MKNYYRILGVDEDADLLQIKFAFRTLAKVYHPDVNDGDKEKGKRFLELSEAFNTLSNPSARVLHDEEILRYRYGLSRPWHPGVGSVMPRRSYPATRVTPRQNRIATLYAFGIILAISVFVLGFLHLRQRYYQLQVARDRQQRLVLFEAARQQYIDGFHRSSLILLEKLGEFREGEKIMENFVDTVIPDLHRRAHESYAAGEYLGAIEYMTLLALVRYRHSPYDKELLAMAYKKSSQPRKAVAVLASILTDGHRDPGVYLELAEIYRDDLDDVESALRCFESAAREAKMRFESQFGKAYMLFLNPQMVDPIHFRLYTGFAEICVRAGQYNRARKIAEWNVEIWPDRAENFVILARCSFHEQDIDRALEYLQKARSVDKSITFETSDIPGPLQ